MTKLCPSVLIPFPWCPVGWHYEGPGYPRYQFTLGTSCIHDLFDKFPLFVVKTNRLWQPDETRGENQWVGTHIGKHQGIPVPHFRKNLILGNDVKSFEASSPYFTRILWRRFDILKQVGFSFTIMIYTTSTAQLYAEYCGNDEATQISKFTGPTWDPPGSCRPQVGPMLAPRTLLSGEFFFNQWR